MSGLRYTCPLTTLYYNTLYEAVQQLTPNTTRKGPNGTGPLTLLERPNQPEYLAQYAHEHYPDLLPQIHYSSANE